MKEKRVKVNKKNRLMSVTLNEEDEYIKRKDKITSFFLNQKYTPMTLNEITSIFNVPKSEKSVLKDILYSLIQEGIIYRDSKSKYKVVNNSTCYKAIYETKNSEYGFAICDDKEEEDIYIPKALSKNAMNGDEILVVVDESKSSSGKSRVGQVVKIIKRSIDVVIGEVYKVNKKYYVLPIDSKIPSVRIKNTDKNAILKVGMIVKIRVTDYDKNDISGTIKEVICDKIEEDSYVKALISSYNLDEKIKFSSKIKKELKSIPSEVSKEDLKGRVNRTNDNVFTIDSEDSKDLDDAVCVVKNIDGSYRLSVHIADVSHYVLDNTEIDKEAVKRGTSIYIPGKVIPMLPKELSNGICSLNEGKIRLTLSVDMEISKKGEVLKHKIYKGYIKSKKKMTYEKVYSCLMKSNKKVLKEYSEFLKDIENMKELALILKNKRLNDGSINFDIPETKIVLDENGKLKDICEYKKTIANDIIEEFMLITNQTVAEEFNNLSSPFIYRVHEKPDEDKLRDLNGVLALYNKRIKSIKSVTPKVISDLLLKFGSEEEKQVISSITLRTLKLAKYDSNCLGHFGLNFKYYCHFTSPIRRYPDLFIHRVISDYIQHGYYISDEKYNKYSKQAIFYSISSSEMEKEATKIERDFDDLYISMYMANKIENEYNGIISSVTSFGLFVKLKNTVEGLVHISSLKGYYVFDDKTFSLRTKSGKMYKIGDKVRIKVDRVDIRLKQIDFKIIGEGKNG